jgi:hypothetical protein
MLSDEQRKNRYLVIAIAYFIIGFFVGVGVAAYCMPR